MALALPPLPVRRQAAAISLASAGTAWAVVATLMSVGASPALLPWTLWNLAGAATIAGSAVLTLHRSVSSQILARGVAVWAVVMGLWSYGGAVWTALHAFVATLAFAALWLSRPALDTSEARAQFDPASHRRVFLAGATVSAFVGVSSVLALVWFGVSKAGGFTQGEGGLFASLFSAVAFLGAAVGVGRMRAWGVLLAIAASLVEGLSVQARHPMETLWLVTVLAPGLLLGAPLVATRLGSGRGKRVARGVDETDHAIGESSQRHVDGFERVHLGEYVEESPPAERARVVASP